MNYTAAWETLNGRSLVHATVDIQDTAIYATGAAIVIGYDTPYSIWYDIKCDNQWRVRHVSLSVLTTRLESTALLSNGEGRWTNSNGQHLPELDGCIDIDLSVTPFTNTFPIRRIHWTAGKSLELKVAYWRLPNLQPSSINQRYTCLENGKLWHYEGLTSGADYNLLTDADGLVLDYPGVFKRL